MPGRTSAGVEGESLIRQERLRRGSEYLRCYRKGRRRHGSLLVLHWVEASPEVGHPRLGITVSRKVGGAVVRQRIKRRIKEIYRRWEERSELPPRDFLVHVKPTAAQATFQSLRRELIALLRRARESEISRGRAGRGLLSRGIVALLAVYKRWISPLLPRACRFEPTCSVYARLSVQKYGALRGSLKALGRIMRCNPFHPGGIDLP